MRKMKEKSESLFAPLLVIRKLVKTITALTIMVCATFVLVQCPPGNDDSSNDSSIVCYPIVGTGKGCPPAPASGVIRDGSGTQTGTYEYSLNLDNYISRRNKKDTPDNIIEYTSFEYDTEGRNISQKIYDNAATPPVIKNDFQFTYHENGRLNRANYSTDNATNYSAAFANTALPARGNAYNSSGTIIGHLEFTYNGNLVTKMKIYQFPIILLESFSYQYDSSGRVTSETEKDASDATIKTITYSY